MADGVTRIQDVAVPELWSPYMQNITTEKSRLIQSGVLTVSADLNAKLSGGGMTFETPSWNDLENDDARISDDSFVPYDSSWDNDFAASGKRRPPDPHKIQSFRTTTIRKNRNNSWSATTLSGQLAGSDPMTAIQDRVGAYWVRQQQRAFIACWRGVLADNIANDNSDMIHDASGNAFLEGTTNFTAENLIDAETTMGDELGQLNIIFVHSIIYARMRKNNLIDFIPDARGETNIPTFLGRQVVVDDGMPNGANFGLDDGVYYSWIFGPGATMYGDVPPPMPVEAVREAGGGNGGGQDVLYSRWQFCMAPEGYTWTGATAASGGPSNADLAAAASWDRKFPERKQIHFACLITREK